MGCAFQDKAFEFYSVIKNMKIEIFKKKNNYKKEDFRIKPDLYWKLILCLVFFITLASFAFGFYLFLQVNKEFVLPANSGGQIETVDKERIEKVLEYFRVREERSDEILNFPPSVIDPSL